MLLTRIFHHRSRVALLGVLFSAFFFSLSLCAATNFSSPQESATAEKLVASNELDKEIHSYEQVVKSHPFSKEAADAQFEVAQLLTKKGDYPAAFKAYTTLLKKYPETPHFEEAVAEQIKIANSYLQGRKVKLLGVPLFSDVERSQEMYEKVLANAPYSKYAALTQFNLGLSLERQGKVTEAIAAYQRLIDKYPTSTICDDALYQIGYVYMSLGMQGRSQDLSALKEGQDDFQDFLIQYPNSEKLPQARDNINAMVARESTDMLRIARFYDFSKNYKSSAIYYNQVIEKYPHTPNASIAKARLAELKSEVGEDALSPGPQTPLSGEQMALRRKMQVQVETTALATYNGPPKKEITPHPDTVPLPEMRTSFKEVTPNSSSTHSSSLP